MKLRMEIEVPDDGHKQRDVQYLLGQMRLAVIQTNELVSGTKFKLDMTPNSYATLEVVDEEKRA